MPPYKQLYLALTEYSSFTKFGTSQNLLQCEIGQLTIRKISATQLDRMRGRGRLGWHHLTADLRITSC